MKKKLILALGLILLCVVVMLNNTSSGSLDLFFTKLKMADAFSYLIFLVAGVGIGVLLK